MIRAKPRTITDWFENPNWTQERLIWPVYRNREWERCGCGNTRTPGAKQCRVCHRLSYRPRWERYMSLWHQGCSYQEIAEDLEMSMKGVYELRRSLVERGYDLPPRRPRRIR